MSWFANLLVHHPFKIIGAVLIFSGSCIIIPFTMKSAHFPTFQDPEMGFTTRGTPIANRLTAWSNLERSSKSSIGLFSTNPKQLLIQRNFSMERLRQMTAEYQRRNVTPLYGSVSGPTSGPVFQNTVFGKLQVYLTESRNHTKSRTKEEKKWRTLLRLTKGNKMLNPGLKDGFFCGGPDERYGHIVVKSTNDKNLFDVDALMDICRLESTFVNVDVYKDLCMHLSNEEKCCKPWSLANYIAILHDKKSCLAITEADVESTLKLLQRCSSYYHEYKLTASCSDGGSCHAPPECIQHDAVFNILNFLTTTSFLPQNKPPNETLVLSETMIFFPMACSTSALPYYHDISKLNMNYGGVEVVAMNFGIKTALFDEILVRDLWLMISGALFVFVCIWLYTQSLFLTIMTIIAIIFSMGISYFMYVLVFEIKFFPFMNLLATIVAIGIGSDDAFIFCKIWHIQKNEKSSSLGKLMTDTFQHAFFSMFVTSLTTSVAFLASYVSSVTAVGCFSIFAGTAVVANYILMMTWFPACVVLWERHFCSKAPVLQSCLFFACLQKWACIKPTWNLSSNLPKCSIIEKLWKSKEQFLLETVIRLRVLWLILFFLIAVISAFIVLVYPKLKLPNSSEFQMFDSSHPFEQYDFKYKNHFWFTREERNMAMSNEMRLPLRFVWGVLPVDNGNFLDPENLGSTVIDESFDIYDPESQIWLLNFCANLRAQPFYESMAGPLLPNCFIETFKKSMTKKCIDGITNQDRTPCCEVSTFPFDKPVFTQCIIEEMAEIFATPNEYLQPGMAGPKFSTDDNPVIKSVVIEYYSNYTYSMSYEKMHEFFTVVESWMQSELKGAPQSMKNGWFVSVLDFYDLQRELSASTQAAITMSMGLALVVLFLSTLNVFTSLYAIITITCTIFVVMAVLVLMGWKLNILESVAVSTAIGLAVDFSLHYTVNYKMCPVNIAKDRIAATKHALTYMAGPALMAAITTGAAGAFMLPSLILPYIQIGIFLVLVMTISWLYATFFLGSLLATIGPQNRFGQFTYDQIFCNPFRPSPTHSNVSSQPTNYDLHELESLTYRVEYDPSKTLQRSSSTGCKPSTSKYMFSDQSPSATSAITIIMADDN